jgi:type VI secretion system protein ImpA
MPVDLQALLRPVTVDAPCGEDLDEGASAGAFLKYRIFGSKVRLETRFEKKLGPEVNWREVRALAEATLANTKDFRVLAHLAASVTRLESLESLVVTLEVAAGWLETFWETVYPRISEDSAQRCNALADFADRMAIVDAVRRLPMVTHKQLGSCSYRDLEIATAGGRAAAEGSGEALDAGAISALIQAVPLQELQALDAVLVRGRAALRSIETRMLEGTPEKTLPDVAPLADLLEKMRHALQKELAPRVAAEANTANAGVENSPAAPGQDNKGASIVSIGSISSRQDALRALDAVGEFFRRNEPSSPVPLFVERAKRLITMNFIQLLEDIVPEAVEHAKSAAGVPKPAE